MWVKHLTMLLGLVITLLGVLPLGEAEDLQPINPYNLNPNASHVCSSNIDEYFTASETYIYSEKYKTYTWCWAIPPRCTVWLTRTSLRSRTVQKVRQRKTYYCCDGYETKNGTGYCFAKCKDNCNNQGYCILPEVCSCYFGFKGTYCESNCSAGTWGPNCEKMCHCGSYGSCDPLTGNCICHVGYTGSDCSTPCRGSFGLHCVHSCICENNATCDNVDGHCTCKPGYMGTYCQLKCPDGMTGEECKQQCQCQNGGECDANGGCICKDGYAGRYCTEKCDDQHWGTNCTQDCLCYNGKCDKETGICHCEMGYGGDNCQTQCPPRYYGSDCGLECSCQNNGTCYYSDQIRTVSCNCSGTGYHGYICHNRDCGDTEYLVSGKCQACDCPWETTASCDIKSGACQCKPGYYGDRCQNLCEMPFYGQDCEELCMCAHGDCHHITGECTKCYAGYLGENCDQQCPVNTWGLNCTQECQCVNAATCSHTTGYCNCTNGYTGLYCAQRCPEGTFGYNCSGTCQCDKDHAICSLDDGRCQCLPGYHGNLCTEQCAEWTYGYQCQTNCSCNGTGTAACDHRTGECFCKSGWKGVECDSSCDEGTWGESCRKTCDCNHHGSCDQLSGACICYAGYIGPYCSQECESGKYGFSCKETCQPCPDNAVCNFKTGECPQPGTCPPGFTGTQCEDLCHPGFWGPACNNTCAETCSGDRGRCNPINGKCTCFPGYRGLQCEFECEDGKYGIACQEDCECIMEQTQKCDHKSGTCYCKPGFKDNLCQSRCPHPFWGPECRFNCSTVCNTLGATGQCNFITGIPCECHVGYEGAHCQNQIGVSITDKQTSGNLAAAAGVNPIIIAVVVVAVILILVIIIIVVYYGRRIRRLKEDNLQVSFNANGIGTLDNSPSQNAMQVGVINPTYESENRNNETRYPHLSSRARPAPDPLPLTTKEVETSCDRRTSGCYEELDEERYTTLKALENQASFDEGACRESEDVNVQKPSYDSKLSDKYVFYTGPKVPNTEAQNSRSQSSTFDPRSRTYEDSYMKPNNLHLAQQTYIPNPSPATSCSTLNVDIDENIEPPADLDLEAIAFENNRFQFGAEPNAREEAILEPEIPTDEAVAFVNQEFRPLTSFQSPNDPNVTENTGKEQQVYDNAERKISERSGQNAMNGQSAVPDENIPTPSMPNDPAIYDNASISSEDSLNLSNDNKMLMNSLTNPYDLPIPPEQRESNLSPQVQTNGYSTPTNSRRIDPNSANQYDTPRMSGTDASPYDTPRTPTLPLRGNENPLAAVQPADLKKALLGDLKKAQKNKSKASNGSVEKNWVSFDDTVGNRQSFA